MRLYPLLAVTAMGCSLAACSSTRVSAPVTSASAPIPVEGYDWFLNQDGDDARLAYGMEASDDLKVGMDCRRGSGRLELSAPGPNGAKDIHLESGGETERFASLAEPSELHDGVFLTAEADADTPVFQRFRRLGWLAVWHDDQRQTLAPHPQSAGNVEKFFVFCG